MNWKGNRPLWIPRQFYFALSNTLTGKAKETLARLEKGLEQPKLQEFLPTWYFPSQQEWHALNQGPTPAFSQFPFRTRLVIVIYYFQFKFQINTAHDVWDRFTHSLQSVHESLQDWGCRLESYVRQAAQYGIHVSWKQYIHQWLVGTQNKAFVKLLTAAMRKDRHGPPVVYDHSSFTEWYQNYKAEALDNKRLSQMQSRLLAANRARSPAPKSQQKGKTSQSNRPTSTRNRFTPSFKTPIRVRTPVEMARGGGRLELTIVTCSHVSWVLALRTRRNPPPRWIPCRGSPPRMLGPIVLSVLDGLLET